MDAIDVLTTNHEKVRSLFLEFRAAVEADDTDTMADVVANVFSELETHTTIEERVFYPAVAETGGAELVEATHESHEEHHVVDVLVEEIKQLSPTDDAYVAKMKVLIENVEHHASEEESEMFPKVRALFSDSELIELGNLLEREKVAVTVENMTAAQLRDAATKLDINGRSDMDRSTLERRVVGVLAVDS